MQILRAMHIPPSKSPYPPPQPATPINRCGTYIRQKAVDVEILFTAHFVLKCLCFTAEDSCAWIFCAQPNSWPDVLWWRSCAGWCLSSRHRHLLWPNPKPCQRSRLLNAGTFIRWFWTPPLLLCSWVVILLCTLHNGFTRVDIFWWIFHSWGWGCYIPSDIASLN